MPAITLKARHPESVSEKLLSFWESVAPFGFHNKTLPFLFVFDEARSLCETDTNGLPVLENYSKYQETPIFPKDKETQVRFNSHVSKLDVGVSAISLIRIQFRGSSHIWNIHRYNLSDNRFSTDIMG